MQPLVVVTADAILQILPSFYYVPKVCTCTKFCRVRPVDLVDGTKSNASKSPTDLGIDQHPQFLRALFCTGHDVV